MSLAASDIKYYKSNDTDSTGGDISASEVVDLTLENVFDNVTADETVDGSTEYRKVFVKNTNISDSWQNIILWTLANSVSEGNEVGIGVGTSDDDDGSRELILMTTDSKVSVVSSDSLDTRNVILLGEVDGVNVTETVVLTGTTPVQSTATFSRLYNASVQVLSSSATITVKQVTLDLTLGTIEEATLSSILYTSPVNSDAGFKLGSLSSNGSQGIWLKRVISPGAEGFDLSSVQITCRGEAN